MRITSGRLPGVALVEPELLTDERGFFARALCARELAAAGIDLAVVQCNISYNRARGTLRGLHYQVAPHAEAKFVRCTTGAIHDVVVDVRPESPTYLQWEAFTLSAANRATLYVPTGIAHGFQTLEDDSEVSYLMSAFYAPECARALAWNDPVLGITWPVADPIISDRDRAHAWLRR